MTYLNPDIQTDGHRNLKHPSQVKHLNRLTAGASPEFDLSNDCLGHNSLYYRSHRGRIPLAGKVIEVLWCHSLNMRVDNHYRSTMFRGEDIREDLASRNSWWIMG